MIDRLVRWIFSLVKVGKTILTEDFYQELKPYRKMGRSTSVIFCVMGSPTLTIQLSNTREVTLGKEDYKYDIKTHYLSSMRKKTVPCKNWQFRRIALPYLQDGCARHGR